MFKLLTRGFFEVEFSSEKDTRATWKLTTIEWSEMTFVFSKWRSKFNASAQGVKLSFSHAMKVQFPNLME